MQQQKEQIPVFSSWRHWYVLVIVVLIGYLLFFTWFTKYFA